MKKCVALLLLLSGCSALQENLTPCAQTLTASGHRDVGSLLAAAQASPACQALTVDLIQAAVREALLRIK